MGRNLQNGVIFNAVGPAATGTAANVEDYEHVTIAYATDGGTVGSTVKFQASIGKGILTSSANEANYDKPDFSAAASVTNHWIYVDTVDLITGTPLDGGTGVVVSSATYKLFSLNVSGIKWLNATITARTDGEVTIFWKGFNNN